MGLTTVYSYIHIYLLFYMEVHPYCPRCVKRLRSSWSIRWSGDCCPNYPPHLLSRSTIHRQPYGAVIPNTKRWLRQLHAILHIYINTIKTLYTYPKHFLAWGHRPAEISTTTDGRDGGRCFPSTMLGLNVVPPLYQTVSLGQVALCTRLQVD